MWLHHQFLLLELDDERGTSAISDSILRQNAVLGAVVAELQLQERLVPVGADVFAIRAGQAPAAGSLGLAEGRLAGRRTPMTIKTCLSRLGGWSSKIRRAALAELIELGALREERDRLWILTWRTRYPEDDPAVERTVRERLGWWVANVRPEDPPAREDLLLSLLRVSKLLPWSLKAPARGSVEERVLERTNRAPIGKVVRDLTRETHAAIAAAAAAGT